MLERIKALREQLNNYNYHYYVLSQPLISDFEFDKLKLPKPDCVLFFDMPPEVSQKLMSGRYNQDETKKDIHERDVDYLNKCRDAALYAADKLGWVVIECAENGEPLPIDTIAQKVQNILKEIIKV